MNFAFRYLGQSGLVAGSSGFSLSFAPNLARERVHFDGELVDPLRFREAVSALHDVVVGDLKFKKKDRSAWQAWKAAEVQREESIRKGAADLAKEAESARLKRTAPPPNLEEDFRRMHELYWNARRRWANELTRNDPELFRHLVPCDPVVTVAPDAVLFECFSKDESSYGCLSVARDAFRGAQEAALGTTNVDYSLSLYDHFQALRSYRSTRFVVDPAGFEVRVAEAGGYREEKIDLPSSWLRGFGQLQSALTLPSRVVRLPVAAVYSVLAHLVRHREKSGPRALRFELVPGRAPKLVLEPWNVEIDVAGPAWDGPPETIKVWGRRRLFALARVLPLAEHVDVRLLGNGLPSVWNVPMGDLHLTLALSGWTANEWTGQASLELLSGAVEASPGLVERLETQLASARSATTAVLTTQLGASSSEVAAAARVLAKRGQAMFDFGAQAYRYRSIMPVALAADVLGPEPEEVVQGKSIAQRKELKVTRREPLEAGRLYLQARIGSTDVEGVFDKDGGLTKAKCACGHFRQFALRAGPCRHLLALRLHVLRGDASWLS